MIKKLFLLILVVYAFIPAFANADDYTLYIWDWCSHCANVEKYIDENNIEIIQKEIFYNEANSLEFLSKIKDLWLNENSVWVPFLYIEKDNGENSYVMWDTLIIDFFEIQKKADTFLSALKRIASRYSEEKKLSFYNNLNSALIQKRDRIENEETLKLIDVIVERLWELY